MTNCTYSGLVPLLLTASICAQIGGNGSDGPFTPTANTVIDTTANGGLFQFTVVTIPAGVTVTITGPSSATILSRGRVDIAGTLSANGASLGFNSNYVPGEGGPGGFRGGQGGLSFGSQWYGNNGLGPGGGGGAILSTQATKGGGGGGHATAGQPGSSPWGGGAGGAAYGASLPFDHTGGSGGGGGYQIGYANQYCGAGGGGALAILANDVIEIAGTVSADGGDSEFLVTGMAVSGPFGGGGGGGAILLRSLSDVRVLAGGTVSARGGVGINLLFSGLRIPSGGDGFVRIDAYGRTPLLQGTVTPTPLVVALPGLAALTPAQLGNPFRLAAASLPGDLVLFFLSFNGANVPLPPYGTISIDLSAYWFLGWDVPLPGNDPLAYHDIAIPNNPSFVGLNLHCQAVNLVTAAPEPRLSNAVVGVVQ
jgi:hypothetical protein